MLGLLGRIGRSGVMGCLGGPRVSIWVWRGEIRGDQGPRFWQRRIMFLDCSDRLSLVISLGLGVGKHC